MTLNRFVRDQPFGQECRSWSEAPLEAAYRWTMLCRRTLSTVVLVPVLTGSALVAAPSLSSAATPPVKIS